MKFIGFMLLYCCFTLGTLRAQTQPAAPVVRGNNDTIKTYVALVDGVNIPWVIIEDVNIHDTRIFKSQADRQAYNRLRYNVIKVIPYAKFAGNRYRQLERDLALTADKKRQKQLIKVCETEIKDKFKKEVVNLTVTQGEVLIKLIDRETHNTTYSLVKELKGGFTAFALQTAARIFGHNLKETYDRDEQRDIEYILQKEGYDSIKN